MLKSVDLDDPLSIFLQISLDRYLSHFNGLYTDTLNFSIPSFALIPVLFRLFTVFVNLFTILASHYVYVSIFKPKIKEVLSLRHSKN